jgi:hypothetical protein
MALGRMRQCHHNKSQVNSGQGLSELPNLEAKGMTLLIPVLSHWVQAVLGGDMILGENSRERSSP